ncbi:imidazole glycerol phosphate synthase subunit hisH [Desulfosporosinus acidiphilus SJ4]|uniref:Imidazole glycerol phosphate synthase subunit HisH n=1 Tax=Desulfosporosinus acidiphilus (strain DSM 22704 / JCM 16185 / SJ4) TaxID=646529 RepID=I4D2F4_DESAJ|nr:imidazole glycerol phosphate synthase subunit HisH [Desulfosporosinus acidiphilus]AFM39978.1 imidazole glycerol phosphate synthase subunit hisH [Desulfosporosinus acidiphilus SJ4]
MIGIVDYGRGNLRSVEKALEKVGFEAKIMTAPRDLQTVDGVILPGVGAFADAMEGLKQGEWIEPIVEFARSGRPFLGICLGMQVLYEVGEEHGEHAGLGLLAGRVVKFPPGRKVPHMGWNSVSLLQPSRLLEEIPSESYFYFVHSFYVLPEDSQDILGTSDYGIVFPAVVGKDNVWGAQFHPEKSSPWGLQLLSNFGKLVNEYAALSSN